MAEPVCTHIVITLIVHDDCPGGMDGFAAIGRLPASDLGRIKAVASPTETQWIADIWGDCGHYDDHFLSDETVSEIFGKPVAELVSRGRQRLAEINDDAANWLAKRHPFVRPFLPTNQSGALAMNLRILKKLSKRAVPLLAHFRIGPDELFLAERRDNHLGVLLMDRSCWDRGRSPHADLIHEREIKRPARDGKGWVYMHPPVHPLKGTPMIGGMDGGEQPEWSEQTAWEALRGFVRWNDKPSTMTDAEWALAQRIARTTPVTDEEINAWMAEDEAATDLEELFA